MLVETLSRPELDRTGELPAGVSGFCEIGLAVFVHRSDAEGLLYIDLRHRLPAESEHVQFQNRASRRLSGVLPAWMGVGCLHAGRLLERDADRAGGSFSLSGGNVIS